MENLTTNNANLSLAAASKENTDQAMAARSDRETQFKTQSVSAQQRITVTQHGFHDSITPSLVQQPNQLIQRRLPTTAMKPQTVIVQKSGTPVPNRQPNVLTLNDHPYVSPHSRQSNIPRQIIQPSTSVQNQQSYMVKQSNFPTGRARVGKSLGRQATAVSNQFIQVVNLDANNRTQKLALPYRNSQPCQYTMEVPVKVIK